MYKAVPLAFDNTTSVYPDTDIDIYTCKSEIPPKKFNLMMLKAPISIMSLPKGTTGHTVELLYALRVEV